MNHCGRINFQSLSETYKQIQSTILKTFVHTHTQVREGGGTIMLISMENGIGKLNPDEAVYMFTKGIFLRKAWHHLSQ